MNLVGAPAQEAFAGLLKYGRNTELWRVEGSSCLRWALREKGRSLEE
jgi:hypothetical protein